MSTVVSEPHTAHLGQQRARVALSVLTKTGKFTPLGFPLSSRLLQAAYAGLPTHDTSTTQFLHAYFCAAGSELIQDAGEDGCGCKLYTRENTSPAGRFVA